MSNQTFLYNTTTGGPTKGIIFNINKPSLIRAAGLTECVDIYMMVGDCPECRPEDVLWSPVQSCGATLQLCPDNNRVILSTKGRYSLGNPVTAPLVLAGDVNITREDGVDPSLLEKSACSPTPSGEDCENALFVKMCDPVNDDGETPVAQSSRESEQACLTQADGLPRNVNVVTTYGSDGTTATRYYSVTGTLITTATTDTISLGPCRVPCPTCRGAAAAATVGVIPDPEPATPEDNG